MNNWSLIAAAGTDIGQVNYPSALAVDTAGNLYVADFSYRWRIQKRDAQGSWSAIATGGTALGQVSKPMALAVDSAGDLYVADEGRSGNNGRIQKRDGEGNWSVIDVPVSSPAPPAGPPPPGPPPPPPGPPIASPTGTLAVDAGGNLYVAYWGRVQKRDAQGHWSVIATDGAGLGQVLGQSALATDAAGSLYVADTAYDEARIPDSVRIQKRDAQGNWSLVAVAVGDFRYVYDPSGLAVDTAGNLYVAQGGGGRVQKRDVQGHWSVLAPVGMDPGQVDDPGGLAVDTAGNLYVADTGNHRVQVYAPGGP